MRTSQRKNLMIIQMTFLNLGSGLHTVGKHWPELVLISLLSSKICSICCILQCLILHLWLHPVPEEWRLGVTSNLFLPVLGFGQTIYFYFGLKISRIKLSTWSVLLVARLLLWCYYYNNYTSIQASVLCGFTMDWQVYVCWPTFYLSMESFCSKLGFE